MVHFVVLIWKKQVKMLFNGSIKMTFMYQSTKGHVHWNEVLYFSYAKCLHIHSVLLVNHMCVSVSHYRLVTYSDYIRYGSGTTIFHDDPQVCVFEVAAVVPHHMGTEHRDKPESEHIHTFISTSLPFDVSSVLSRDVILSVTNVLFPEVESGISCLLSVHSQDNQVCLTSIY